MREAAEGLRELADDAFYQFMQRYPDLCVDCCLAASGETYRGEPSHRAAAAFAVSRAGERWGICWKSDVSRARAREIPAAVLLALPDRPWKTTSHGVTVFHQPTDGGDLPLWYAFLEPPYGTSRVLDEDERVEHRAYTVKDFQRFCRALFPMGTEQLTVYQWTTDWSDYFDAGHEWWGASCWTVYDAALDRYAVILASATD